MTGRIPAMAMSVFTNPASGARDEAAGYIRAVLDLLGDRDPLVVLSATVPALIRGVGGLDEETLRRPEAPGKWSLLDVVWHLADSDLVWAYRLRMILAHDRPTLGGYDQDLWADRLRYRDRDLEPALDQLRVLREGTLILLATLTPEQWKRAGVHDERGDETVEHLVRLYAGHDLVHLRQAERIRGVVAG